MWTKPNCVIILLTQPINCPFLQATSVETFRQQLKVWPRSFACEYHFSMSLPRNIVYWVISFTWCPWWNLIQRVFFVLQSKTSIDHPLNQLHLAYIVHTGMIVVIPGIDCNLAVEPHIYYTTQCPCYMSIEDHIIRTQGRELLLYPQFICFSFQYYFSKMKYNCMLSLDCLICMCVSNFQTSQIVVIFASLMNGNDIVIHKGMQSAMGTIINIYY